MKFGQDYALFTRSNNSIMMEVTPRIVSFRLNLSISRYTFSRQSKKPSDSNFKPRRPFNWDTAIITDVADVKPTVTGMEMKSINTPKSKTYIFM